MRARGLPGGRAALFLAGTALAAGCADEPDDALDDETRIGPDAGTQKAPGDASINAARDTGILGQQPYGISIDQWPRDASIVTPRDAGSTCPQVGNLPVPVYGIAVDSGARPSLCEDAGQDTGSDAATDAGEDSGLIGVPTYGVAIDPGQTPIPPYGVAIDGGPLK